jgi:2-polyprenyl-3-methyl-5-hydroxy-6-metoxy-1,4-benzoquinol methylase
MTDLASQIQTFYSKIKFPGLYDLEDLNFYQEGIDNKFLSIYNTGIQGSKRILDIGCGTGFITNLLAIKNPDIVIDAVDFSDSVDFAQQFSVKNKIKNVTYYKEDFFKFVPTYQYDCVICNGVLHHMPEFKDAIDKIKTLIVPSGKLILGVYNYYGKSFKKLLPVTYRSELLRMDQEDVPYEINFTNKEFLNYFKKFKIDTIYPSVNNHLVDIANLRNYKNGGLTIYNLTRELSDNK